MTFSKIPEWLFRLIFTNLPMCTTIIRNEYVEKIVMLNDHMNFFFFFFFFAIVLFVLFFVVVFFLFPLSYGKMSWLTYL